MAALPMILPAAHSAAKDVAINCVVRDQRYDLIDIPLGEAFNHPLNCPAVAFVRGSIRVY